MPDMFRHPAAELPGIPAFAGMTVQDMIGSSATHWWDFLTTLNRKGSHTGCASITILVNKPDPGIARALIRNNEHVQGGNTIP